jgi:hypothetical protein
MDLLDHFENLAHSDCFTLAAQREATKLRKQLEWLHASDATRDFEAADGDLVLLDETRPTLEVLLARLLVDHADDHLELDLDCRRMDVHDGVEAGANNRRTFQDDDLGVKDFANMAHVFQITQDETTRDILITKKNLNNFKHPDNE